jgi:WD40 repeat protein
MLLWRVVTHGHGTAAATIKDRTATLWDAARQAQPTHVATPRAHGGRITSVAFDPDGQRLVTGSADHAAIIWRVGDGGDHTDPRGDARRPPGSGQRGRLRRRHGGDRR